MLWAEFVRSKQNKKKEYKMSDVNGRNIIMGFQHTFVMFGATILVPLITGLDIGVTLFAAGIGTLLFHFLTKRKVTEVHLLLFRRSSL